MNIKIIEKNEYPLDGPTQNKTLKFEKNMIYRKKSRTKKQIIYNSSFNKSEHVVQNIVNISNPRAANFTIALVSSIF